MRAFEAIRRTAYLVALAAVSFSVAPKAIVARTLEIQPVAQETYVWCWLAVSEMVFQHFDVPKVHRNANFQCGIIAAVTHGTPMHACSMNCLQCTIPAGTAANLVHVLQNYPRRIRSLTRQSAPNISARSIRRALSRDDVVSEIDSDNPIIAGISPAGRPGGSGSTAQHVALIVGYERDGRVLIVNDPYPFQRGDSRNPYLAAGGREIDRLQYEIDYDSFRRTLNWTESITVEKADGDSDQEEMPNYCCTPAGRLGPYPNDGTRVGEPCYATLPNGLRVSGRACR